jgi:hypothetical protein
MADLFSWYTYVCYACSLHLVLTARPICPAVTLETLYTSPSNVTFYIKTEKNMHLFRPVNGELALTFPGVYCIPNECDTVYTGQMGHMHDRRSNKQALHIQLHQLHKLLGVKHQMNLKGSMVPVKLVRQTG